MSSITHSSVEVRFFEGFARALRLLLTFGMRTKLSVVAVIVVMTAMACGRLQLGSSDKAREMDAALRGVLSGRTPDYATKDPEGAKLWKQTQSFYARRQYQPAWIENAKPGPQIEALVQSLREADAEGLDPNLYNVAMIEQRHAEASKGFITDKGFDPSEAGTLDVWFTYLYMKYASDLADGLSDLSRADKTWKITPEKFDPLQHLEKALAEDRITDSLRELTPRAPEYQRLRTTLSDYRQRKAQGGWPTVPANVKLKPGQRSPHVGIIAKRLAATGDYRGTLPPEREAALYEGALVEAVKTFQRRHGLTDDGIISPAVTAEMNVPVERRIAQIEMNMERWRWLPRDLGERYILVNIPEMRLDIYEGDRVTLTMRTVVGKEDTPTPIFNDVMTHIVFSPYWNVPPTIAAEETLPAVMNDPGFLARNNMEIVDAKGNQVDPASVDLNNPEAYRFRQRPGGDNSLGLVKFMFPNQFNVYLHDTPADSLFARATRSYSHGCVRLEQPVELAKYVLRDQPEWDAARIEEAMHAGTEKHVKLKSPIPVYLGYWTARVRPDGTVQFRKDVYRTDARQTALLQDRLQRLRRSSDAAVAATTIKETKTDAKGSKGKSAKGKPASR
jgi:L,D-transpeptidase YcbB